MKQLCKVVLVAAGSVLAAQVGHAQWNEGDIVIGFNNGTGSTPLDYAVHLGSASQVGIGGTSTVDLSTLGFSYSTFNTDFGGLSGVTMAGVGGDTGNTRLYDTTLRTSNFGNPQVAGSTAPTLGSPGDAGSGAVTVASFVSANGITAGSGFQIAPNNANSFYSWILDPLSANQTGGNFRTTTGLNPGASTTGTTLREDLWFANNSTTFTYEGFFTIDSSLQKLTFTPATVAVPEPSTYGLIAGAGLLLVALRGKFSQKTA